MVALEEYRARDGEVTVCAGSSRGRNRRSFGIAVRVYYMNKTLYFADRVAKEVYCTVRTMITITRLCYVT